MQLSLIIQGVRSGAVFAAFVLLLLCSVGVSAIERYPLVGLVDSSGERGFWEARTRVPVRGVLITSETYVRVAVGGTKSSLGDAQFDETELVETFDVIRVQLVGQISNDPFHTLRRVALSGSLSSADENLLRRYALEGQLSNVGHELAERFSLDGVISSEQDVVELAFVRRTDSPPKRPDLIDVIEPELVEKESRTWSRSRSLLGQVNRHVSTYLRSDRISRSDGGEDSLLFAVRPYFSLALNQPRWSLKSRYELESAEYLEGTRENYTNHEASADFDWRMDKNDQFVVAAVYRNWHSRRTKQAIEDFNAGVIGEFEYDSVGLNGAWNHGSKDDRLRYVVTGGVETTTVESASEEQGGYDLENRRISATGYWRIKRRMTFLFDTRYQTFDYVDRQDSRQYLMAPGVEFVSRRRVTGRALAGYQNKKHQGLGDETGGFVWNVDLSWRPLKQTTLGLESARDFLEIYARGAEIEFGEFGIQEFATIKWQQAWSPKLTSNLSFTYQQRDYAGLERKEDAYQFLLGTTYKLSPSLTIRGDGTYTNQKSIGISDYDRWTLTMSADMKL